ncbi:alpha/beta fold hydrolase [Streptomyces sp. TRM72054]|uniref:alpha/beta fold hydrolase n=1 Tax=Streptomyces sp. TRM72054 TaxID=2870562 RepID=UPI0035ABCD6B
MWPWAPADERPPGERLARTRVHEVLCVHGLGCSYRYWLPFARELAPDIRTVAADLPGFGRMPGLPGPLDVHGAVAGACRLAAGPPAGARRRWSHTPPAVGQSWIWRRTPPSWSGRWC